MGSVAFLKRGRELAGADVPGTQAARTEPPHRPRGLRRRTATRPPPHRRPQPVRRGLEPRGAGTGRSLPVAERHPPAGRPRAVVRLPANVRQLAGGGTAAGASVRQADEAEEGEPVVQQRPAARAVEGRPQPPIRQLHGACSCSSMPNGFRGMVYFFPHSETVSCPS